MTTAPERTCVNGSCREPYVNPPARRHRRSWSAYRGNLGYCPRCYRRWASHGYPAAGPGTARSGRLPGPRASRLEDYTELRSMGLTRAEMTRRLGVTRRTIERYEASLREAGEAQAA